MHTQYLNESKNEINKILKTNETDLDTSRANYITNK